MLLIGLGAATTTGAHFAAAAGEVRCSISGRIDISTIWSKGGFDYIPDILQQRLCLLSRSDALTHFGAESPLVRCASFLAEEAQRGGKAFSPFWQEGVTEELRTRFFGLLKPPLNQT